MNNEQFLKPCLMPIGELFKKSFESYIRKVWTLAVMALFNFMAVVPLLVFSLVGILINNISEYIILTLLGYLLVFIGLILSIVIGAWTSAALLFAVKEEKIKFKQLFIMAYPKIFSLFWVSCLNIIIIAAGFVFLIVPGFIFCIWFLFSSYVLIAENLKGVSALKRSKELTRGYWWAVFGRYLTIIIIGAILSWSPFVGFIVYMVFLFPFQAVFLYVLYEDLKRIKSQPI